jgi:hypothetical protein
VVDDVASFRSRHAKHQQAWREANRERYNTYQREYKRRQRGQWMPLPPLPVKRTEDYVPDELTSESVIEGYFDGLLPLE